MMPSPQQPPSALAGLAAHDAWGATMLLLEHPQGSPEWFQARAGAATASRFSDARGSVNGLSPQQAMYVEAILAGQAEKDARVAAGYKARPQSVKIDRALKGETFADPSPEAVRYGWTLAHERVAMQPLDDTFTTYAMKRGTALEPHAKALYEARTGRWVDDTSLILTPDLRFGYSSDGLCSDDGLIEVKCPLSCEKLGNVWSNPAEAHVEYLDQIDGGLWLTGRKWCDLVVYCPWLAPVGKDLFIKRIWRDDDRIERLETDLCRFAAMVDDFEALLRAELPTTYELPATAKASAAAAAPRAAAPAAFELEAA